MDAIDFLTEVYEDYCTKHGLPYVSADEQDEGLNVKHDIWLRSFSQLWDYAQHQL